jgi:hypothetical protein
MLLELGPVNFGPDPPLPDLGGRPSLEALAQEEADWIEAYLAEGDGDLNSAFWHTDEPWGEFIDGPLLESAEAINLELGWQPDPTMEGAAAMEPEIELAFSDAYTEVPAESWQPVPAPFVPPQETSEFTGPVGPSGGDVPPLEVPPDLERPPA